MEELKDRHGSSSLKDRPGPSSHKPKKVLYLCFGEYLRSSGNYYSIHAFDLEKNCYILPLAESSVVAKTKRRIPAIMGSGVYGSKIVLAGGIKPEFDGFENFTACPCKKVYEFDTAIMSSHPPDVIQHHRPLQHGNTQPLMVEHEGNLYVLSLGQGFKMSDPKYNTWVTLPEPPFFHRRYLRHPSNCVVVGTNIFVSCLFSIFRFDMADTSQTWKEHSFTNFTACPCKKVYEFDTAIMSSHPPNVIQHHRPLQHGKTQPLVLEHEGNLYALSLLKGQGFEMFDPKYNIWVTLPEPLFFHRRYLRHPINCVVVGTNIFVSCLSSIFRFDMADTSQTWTEHSFTNCTTLPYGFYGERSLTVEMSDGNWLIFTCFSEFSSLHDTDEFKDDCCCEVIDCNYSDEDCPPYTPRLDPHRHYEWLGTSLHAYLMSKDFTSLTPIQPLCLPDDLLPTQPGCKLLPRLRDLYTAKPRDIDYSIVHLGGQEICLILSVDTGFESKGGVLRKMPIFVVSFEFQLSDSKDLLTIKTGSCSVQCFLLGANSSSATKISMYGAFWL